MQQTDNQDFEKNDLQNAEELKKIIVEQDQQLPQGQQASHVESMIINESNQEQSVQNVSKQNNNLDVDAENLNLSLSVNLNPNLDANQTSTHIILPQKVDRKLSVKKPKFQIESYIEFIPQFLIFLNQQKFKSVIRIGKDYQAQVPQKCLFSHRYRPLSHLKIWSSENGKQFENSSGALKKFKEKFGESRNQEDMCMLMYQYQCDWGELGKYIGDFKGELRKYYVTKDRAKM